MNFSAGSGELVAILGPNGAGKTTLLRCMMGFLTWNEGRCLIDGEDIRTLPSRKLWQRVSYVPQARGAFASMTARDMILLGCTNRIGVFSVPGSAQRAQAEELAEQLGISGLLDKKCTEISGGELQMVLIARALAAKPELLILDEPESNLDFKNQLIVLDTMSRLAAEGMCCIFNTHYPTHALMRASKSLILQKGGASIFGDTPTVLTEDNIKKAFGVQAVIGEIETAGNIYYSILPLKIIEKEEAEGLNAGYRAKNGHGSDTGALEEADGRRGAGSSKRPSGHSESGNPEEPSGHSESGNPKESSGHSGLGSLEESSGHSGSGSPKEVSAQPDTGMSGETHGQAIAVISLIFRDYSLSDRINGLLHEYRDYIIGRMGVPYRDGGVCIVNVTLDAPRESIAALSHRLNILPGVNVKTTYAG